METGARSGRSEGVWQARAERVSDAFGLVLILVLATYVLASIFDNRGWPAVLLAISSSATSIVALTGSRVKPEAVRGALFVAAVALGMVIVYAAVGGRFFFTASSLLQIGLLVVAMGAVLQRVLTSGTVSSRTIAGAISVYATLGILFTWVYGIIDRIEGGGFFEGASTVEGSDFLFFSYTTLTTTGYGNLVPAGQLGRMVSGLEMMLGQIFLVTLVAGLVSLWRPGQSLLRRREQRSEREAAASGGDA